LLDVLRRLRLADAARPAECGRGDPRTASLLSEVNAATTGHEKASAVAWRQQLHCWSRAAGKSTASPSVPSAKGRLTLLGGLQEVATDAGAVPGRLRIEDGG